MILSLCSGLTFKLIKLFSQATYNSMLSPKIRKFIRPRQKLFADLIFIATSNEIFSSFHYFTKRYSSQLNYLR